MINREDLIRYLDEGKRRWQAFINNLNDKELLEYFAWNCNMRNGTNYTEDYFLNGTIENILENQPYKVNFFRNCLLDYNYNERKINRFLDAVEKWRKDESNYSFSYVTGLANDTHDALWDEPTLDWFATVDGFRWFACYC